jgi:hypothetical protein
VLPTDTSAISILPPIDNNRNDIRKIEKEGGTADLKLSKDLNQDVEKKLRNIEINEEEKFSNR